MKLPTHTMDAAETTADADAIGLAPAADADKTTTADVETVLVVAAGNILSL